MEYAHKFFLSWFVGVKEFFITGFCFLGQIAHSKRGFPNYRVFEGIINRPLSAKHERLLNVAENLKGF